MAEIPVQPKRRPEIPVEPRRRRSIWPWVLGLLALILLPFLFLRDRDEVATAPDTAAFVDTTSRLGGQTTSAAGSIAPSTDTAGAQARTRTPAARASSADTTLRTDTAAATDTTTRRP